VSIRPIEGGPASDPATARLVDILERLVIGGVGLTTLALDRAIDGPDLTFPQWRAILVVGESAGGATISAVAARVGVTVPATSRQLRRLAERGLMVHEVEDHDRRSTRVRLTEEGVRVRAAILAQRRTRIAELVAAHPMAPTTLDELAALADAFDGYA
jgi:DNA-binding MarR family transcriptional regulator